MLEFMSKLGLPLLGGNGSKCENEKDGTMAGLATKDGVSPSGVAGQSTQPQQQQQQQQQQRAPMVIDALHARL